MATDEAYEAATEAASAAYLARVGVPPAMGDGHYVRVYAVAAVDAVWDLAVAEGRIQAREEADNDGG
jgi:hypothetical protein